MSTVKRRGFTLIELLVVIAIIAILAAILFPVFARAKAKARQTTCLSNVKQLAVSVKMYQSDWDDCFPKMENWEPPPPLHTTGYCHRWTYSVHWPTYPTSIPGGSLQPYVQNDDILVCPDWQKSQLTNGEPWRSYQGNIFLMYRDSSSWASPICEGRIRNPADIIMMAEAEFGTEGAICAPGFPWTNQPVAFTNPAAIPPTTSRHMENFNANFVDGHAKACSDNYWVPAEAQASWNPNYVP